MHFRLARSKGIFTWHCYVLQAKSGWSRTSMNTIASLYQAFQKKMRANVTQKRHPTPSGNEKRRICIPKVQMKSSCACRIAFLK